jgi:hypothetical protein
MFIVLSVGCGNSIGMACEIYFPSQVDD